MSNGKMINPAWFGNNQDAINVYLLLQKLLDVWDNMIDKDKPVSNEEINECFLTCLCRLPLNPVYSKIQQQVAPMWLGVVSAYESANTLEKTKDNHCLAISHILRYSIGNIFAYIMMYCTGIEESRKHIPDMWSSFVAEDYETYAAEHRI